MWKSLSSQGYTYLQIGKAMPHTFELCLPNFLQLLAAIPLAVRIFVYKRIKKVSEKYEKKYFKTYVKLFWKGEQNQYSSYWDLMLQTTNIPNQFIF